MSTNATVGVAVVGQAVVGSLGEPAAPVTTPDERTVSVGPEIRTVEA